MVGAHKDILILSQDDNIPGLVAVSFHFIVYATQNLIDLYVHAYIIYIFFDLHVHA